MAEFEALITKSDSAGQIVLAWIVPAQIGPGSADALRLLVVVLNPSATNLSAPRGRACPEPNLPEPSVREPNSNMQDAP